MGFLVPRMEEDGGGGEAIAGEVTCFGVVTDVFDRVNKRAGAVARIERGKPVPSRCIALLSPTKLFQIVPSQINLLKIPCSRIVGFVPSVFTWI